MTGLYNLKQGVAALSDLEDGRQAGLFPVGVNNVWYVDSTNGSDSYSGESWDDAFATVDAAITANNATIDWSTTPDRYNAIFIAPGVYAENLTHFPYYCYVIGCGVRGTDTQTEIHPTTGSCFAGTMLGTIFINIRFEVNTAVPCLDVGICNNSQIIGCTFTNGAAVAATAVDTDNCTHLWVDDCDVESGQLTGMAYGFYFRGGSNKFAHNVRIRNTRIFASTAGVWIQDTCTATQCLIGPDVFIAGATKGIDDNNGGSYVFGNFITGTDAIEHANSSTQCVGNSVINDGTGAKEASGT